MRKSDTTYASPAEKGEGGKCHILHLEVVTMVILKCVLASAWTDLTFTHGQITAGRILRMLTDVSITYFTLAGRFNVVIFLAPEATGDSNTTISVTYESR